MNVWRPLEHPAVWEVSRVVLDLLIGLYRRRMGQLARWGVPRGAPSVLDVGCGVGQYSVVTRGAYLGVDLDERYLRYAERRRGSGTRAFRRVALATLRREGAGFDVVLLVDVLHHLPDGEAVAALVDARTLARRMVVCFDATSEQRNGIGQWIVDHDRGEYMRTSAAFHQLFLKAGLPIAESTELMLGPLRTHAVLCRVGEA